VREVCAPGVVSAHAAGLVAAAARWLDDEELAELLATTAAQPSRT